jgi:predicted HD superfamily hydrolase involved in NAD metabolism
MEVILADLVRGIDLTGEIPDAVSKLLTVKGFPKTIQHSHQVADEAARLAARFNVNQLKAVQAGWLHDVSVVFLFGQRAEVARRLGIDLLLAEEQNPVLIHQKLSVVMAQEIFNITDSEVLSAIGCHTTLKPKASSLDKILFVADKIAWNQADNPPYVAEMAAAALQNLDKAAFVYIRSLMERQTSLSDPLHPWLIEAYYELKQLQVN